MGKGNFSAPNLVRIGSTAILDLLGNGHAREPNLTFPGMTVAYLLPKDDLISLKKNKALENFHLSTTSFKLPLIFPPRKCEPDSIRIQCFGK